MAQSPIKQHEIQFNAIEFHWLFDLVDQQYSSGAQQPFNQSKIKLFYFLLSLRPASLPLLQRCFRNLFFFLLLSLAAADSSLTPMKWKKKRKANQFRCAGPKTFRSTKDKFNCLCFHFIPLYSFCFIGLGGLLLFSLLCGAMAALQPITRPASQESNPPKQIPQPFNSKQRKTNNFIFLYFFIEWNLLK